ncbi:type II secretion system F family protein [Gilvibacter sediminis]|uniref:type II secretion system F family protein n=1 Tax=Gilvibacter sediminis TaxID=379071 RepID=UPI0023506502|nr:type II secretion system F family protein [Gilvibacter sediminis]MDC7996891.1 type II secretion system F family protein [Gilvibacter sediminis]
MEIEFENTRTSRKEQQNGIEQILNKEINLFGGSFSSKKKEYFYRELSILMQSGVSLKAALEIMLESQEKKKDKAFIERLITKVVSGKLLSEAIADEPGFSSYEQHALRIADRTGQKEVITSDLYHYYLNKNKQRRQLYGSLTYPIIVMLTAIGVTFFMLKFVVPTFQDTFRQNEVNLPGITEFIIGISEFVSTNGWMLFFGSLLIILLFSLIRKTNAYKRFIGKFVLRVPLIGNHIKRSYIVQFTHAMSLLTKSKVPLVTALGLVKEMIAFYPLSSALSKVESQIMNGELLHKAFGRNPFFEKKMIALLKVAEETSQTEYIFNKLYEQYRDDLVYQSRQLSNILNPVLTLLVGFVVGIILLAMYLPMFQLSSLIE